MSNITFSLKEHFSLALKNKNCRFPPNLCFHYLSNDQSTDFLLRNCHSATRLYIFPVLSLNCTGPCDEVRDAQICGKCCVDFQETSFRVTRHTLPAPLFILLLATRVDVMSGAGKHLSHKAKDHIIVTENCSHSLLGGLSYGFWNTVKHKAAYTLINEHRAQRRAQHGAEAEKETEMHNHKHRWWWKGLWEWVEVVRRADICNGVNNKNIESWKNKVTIK